MKKLLSHRLKGYSKYENSIFALRNILEDKVNYLEIDIRLSKDKKLFVCHDPFIIKNDKKVYIHESNSDELLVEFTKEILPTLDYFLKIFKKNYNNYSKLCLDIKDYNCEESILSLVEKYDLNDEVVYITWMPETILKLYQLGVDKDIYFSYFPLNTKMFSGIISFLISYLSVKAPPFYHITGNKFRIKTSSKYLYGYQRVVMTTKIPSDVINILQITKGGVCVEKKLIDDSLLKRLKDLNLQTWIFGLNVNDDYFELEKNPNIDVIFSENAKYVIEHSD